MCKNLCIKKALYFFAYMKERCGFRRFCTISIHIRFRSDIKKGNGLGDIIERIFLCTSRRIYLHNFMYMQLIMLRKERRFIKHD